MSIYKGIYDYVQDDYTRNMLDDLQLAAELGKTLLERNKELETSLKQHQNVIEDQTQEIEYLTKQTVALREVNDSRLRIYEQLEVSIQDLERANHRLALENSSDKKQLKNLTANLEALEIKCEELQGTIDHLTLQLESEKRRQLSTPDPIKQTITLRHTERDEVDASEQFYNSPKKEENQMPKEEKSKSSEIPLVTTEKQDKEKDDPDSANEQVTELMVQLRESRTSFYREQRRVSELEEQLSTMIHQNQTLEKQLVQLNYKEEEPKSMHEELTTLEEVQHGQLCRRCLRTMDSQRTGDNLSCLGDEAEDDDSSVFEALINDSQYRSSFTMDIQDKSEFRNILRREMSMLWMWPGPTLLSVLIDLLLYIKDRYIFPFLCKPWRYPLILLHCVLRHDKIHQL
uniref:HAP1 N-terminal domain-containing protein n=1 Tax=Photinus pyralis TaxID=7054 RepID=A0A1Y1NAH4_PHOPY